MQEDRLYLKPKPLIVVVDDDESVREALENLISSVGFEVKLFASAEDFLDSDSRMQTDCAILDVRLPGISGPELQQSLAAGGQSIPIIIITAQGGRQDSGRSSCSGRNCFS